jgi:hypothetical protein
LDGSAGRLKEPKVLTEDAGDVNGSFEWINVAIMRLSFGLQNICGVAMDSENHGTRLALDHGSWMSGGVIKELVHEFQHVGSGM